MYNYLLEITMMASLGIIIYLFARAIPRVEDNIPDSSHSMFDKLIASLPMEKIDVAFSGFLEKFLRKIRLVILRFDNILGKHLNNLKKFSDSSQKNNEEKPTLFSSNGNGGISKEKKDSEK